MKIEDLIIKNLLHNSEFVSKIISIIKPEYFEDFDIKIVDLIKRIYDKYDKLPTYQVLEIYFNEKDKTLSENGLSKTIKRIKELQSIEYQKVDIEYLLNETEKFFKDKALFNAIFDAVKKYDNKDDTEEIPNLISEALRVSIDNSVGHSYLDKSDTERQFLYYNQDINKYGTHLETFNDLIGGGFERKTLSVFCGEPKIGKSRLLTDFSVYFIKMNLNVLYVTLELSENLIRQRVDANLLSINMNEFKNVDKETYLYKIENLKDIGTLIIKEYSGNVNSNMIDALLHEIKIKKQINIDVLMMDYLTIMDPIVNLGKESGSLYVRGKMIAKELRSVCVKYDLIGITALHLNRGGWGTLDVKMKDIAESAGIAHVADMMIAIMSTEEMIERKRLYLKVINNRLFDLRGKVMLGFDNDRMTHFCVGDKKEDDNNLKTKFGDIEL